MPRYSYKCKDKSCGHGDVLFLPSTTNFSHVRACPACKRRLFARDLIADARTTQFNDEASRYNFRFPYKSTTFPQNAAGAEHDKAGHPIITSAKHEQAMRELHGYVGENKVTHSGEEKFKPVKTQMGHRDTPKTRKRRRVMAID